MRCLLFRDWLNNISPVCHWRAVLLLNRSCTSFFSSLFPLFSFCIHPVTTETGALPKPSERETLHGITVLLRCYQMNTFPQLKAIISLLLLLLCPCCMSGKEWTVTSKKELTQRGQSQGFVPCNVKHFCRLASFSWSHPLLIDPPHNSAFYLPNYLSIIASSCSGLAFADRRIKIRGSVHHLFAFHCSKS